MYRFLIRVGEGFTRAVASARCAALVALTALTMVTGATLATPVSAVTGDGQLSADTPTVEITDLTPRVLGKETTVRVEATITSPTELKDFDLNLYMRSDSFVTSPQMQAYLEGESRAGAWLTSEHVERVAADTPTAVTISVDRDQLPLGSTWEWGPRGITVTAATPEGPIADRSVLIWDSGYEVQPTRIAVVAPLTQTMDVSESGEVRYRALTNDEIESAKTLAQTPGVLLAASATTWQGYPDLVKELRSRQAQALALPQGDADVAAIAQLPDRKPLTNLVETSLKDANQASDEAALTTWVLPQSPQLDRKTIAAWAGKTVLAPADIEPIHQLTYHPSLFSRYSAATGQPTSAEDPEGVNVVVPQGELSALIGARAPRAADALDVTQMLVANSAIITRELPNQSRSVVALAARGSDLKLLAQRSQQLLNQRWVQPLTTSDLQFSKDTELVEREPLAQTSQIAGAVTDQQVSQGLAALDSVSAMADAVTDPAPLTATLNQQLLALSSIQLRLQPDQRQRLLAAMSTGADHIDTLVNVAQSAPINLLDAKANLPIRVENSYGEPVNVVVHLRPSDPRLQVLDDATVTVPANASTLAEIPVNAIGSGNVTIRVIVKSASGLVIDDHTILTVRVRAGWESTATLVGAILLGLLVLVGIVRTVRRGRRMKTVEDRGSDEPKEDHA